MASGPRTRSKLPSRVLQRWRGAWLEVETVDVMLPGERHVALDIARHPGAACVVPFLDDDHVLLIRQYRHATGGELLEVPAGKLEPGEAPERCAARELQEEAGQRPGRLERLASIWTTPGFTDEVIHLYAAFELEGVAQDLQEYELIELLPTRFTTALEWVWSGRIDDAKSALALVHAARRLGRLVDAPVPPGSRR